MKAYGTAPFSRIQASAQHVSRPPENAIPTCSPIGSVPEDRAAGLLHVRDHARSWWSRKSSEQLRAGRAVAGGDEDRVLAGERARDLCERGLVDRLGQGGRRAPAAVWTTSSCAARRHLADPAPERRRELVEPVEVGGAGERVDQAPRLVAHLHQPELGDVARDGRLHRLDAVRRGAPRRPRSASTAAAAGRAEGSPPAARTSSSPDHLPQDLDRPVRLIRRDRERRREPERRLARGADEQAPLERRRRPRALPAGRARSRGAGRAPRTPGSASKRAPTPRGRGRAARRPSRPTTAHAAAQATGLPPNVEAWSPGTKPVGASSETSSAPIGRPFASPFASVTASGRTPSCSQAKNAPVRPTPVCTSSRTSIAPCASASVPRDARASRVRAAGRRPRPAPARAGSRRCRRRRHRRGSPRVAKRTPGRSGANGSRFAGWPVTESAPSVRPWNEPSSATKPVLAGRLARPLQRRLDRLRAGVAEERARAPPKRSESAAASSSIGVVE